MLLRRLTPLLCFLALSVPQTLSAQQPDPGSGPPQHMGPPPGPQPPAQELARLDHALTLTDAQKTAILPILEKRRTDMEALRQNGSDPGANRQGMRSIMETSRTAIRAQLTEAQGKTFDSMRPGRGGGPGGPGGPGDGNGPPPPPSGDSGPPPPPQN